MKILIINGSPKGAYSTTLHTCLYLEKKFPGHEFTQLDAGKRIRSLEKDFAPAAEMVREADVLLFSYPVYTFLVPYQLHRFLELLQQNGVSLEGKWATQVTTSKHFYDITAHRFIEDWCADMGLPFLDGLSADMDDLLKDSGRSQAEEWMRFTLWKAARGEFKAPQLHQVAYSPSLATVPAGNQPAAENATAENEAAGQPAAENAPACNAASQPASEALATKRTVIVADLEEGDEALAAMIERFKSRMPGECDVVNIREFPFLGGCMSCFSCASTGKCIYADGFDEFLRGTIHKHDAIVYAFRIRNHSMGSRFKMYDDRQFCNGHRTVTMGTPFAYLIEGAYSGEENLRMVLEARAQVGGNFLAGVATDEGDVDTAIDTLAATLGYALEHPLTPPQNFLGVGGMRIFRDLIYMMRGLMRADHRFFKSHGQYDFPQKQWRTSLMMYPVGWMMGSRKLRAKMGTKLNDGMISSYRKVVEEA